MKIESSSGEKQGGHGHRAGVPPHELEVDDMNDNISIITLSTTVFPSVLVLDML